MDLILNNKILKWKGNMKGKAAENIHDLTSSKSFR